MKILFVYTAMLNVAYIKHGNTVLDDISRLPTTHASEVNYLLMCYWLREAGHEVHIFSGRGDIPQAVTHFPIVSESPGWNEEYDVLFLFKLHGLKTAQQHGLFQYSWRKVLTWMDTPRPDNILGEDARRITHHAWGTEAIWRDEHPRFPSAKHTVVEHATTFACPPELSPMQSRGLYAGRMPACYRDQVLQAAQACPMLVYALWLETGLDTRVLLRPGQYKPEQLEVLRATLPNSIDLRPGSNMVQEATEASACAFGLCSATVDYDKQQVLSASKFYDYLALGLPVLLADNVPESHWVQGHAALGHCYKQAATAPTSMHEAIAELLGRPEQPEVRRARQDWVFENHTYRNRAENIHAFITA